MLETNNQPRRVLRAQQAKLLPVTWVKAQQLLPPGTKVQRTQQDVGVTGLLQCARDTEGHEEVNLGLPRCASCTVRRLERPGGPRQGQLDS